MSIGTPGFYGGGVHRRRPTPVPERPTPDKPGCGRAFPAVPARTDEAHSPEPLPARAGRPISRFRSLPVIRRIVLAPAADACFLPVDAGDHASCRRFFQKAPAWPR